MAVGLARWFGAFGARALLARALAAAQAHHPALSAVSVLPADPGTPPSSYVTGIAESERAHGGEPTADAVVAMVACLMDLMGRLIGEELAMTVLEQSTAGPLSPSFPVTPLASGRSGSPTPASPPNGGPASPGAASPDIPLTATET